MRLGVLGGTFDPIHAGHLILGEAAREQLDLARVLFVPTGHSWRKGDREIAPGSDRLEMVRRAIAGNPHFESSTLELDREGPSYSEVTLAAIKGQHPDADLFFILGRDALADLPNWHDPQAVVELATLAVAERSGDGGAAPLDESALPGLQARLVTVQMPRIDVSATDVRDRVRAGRSIRYLVPDAVADSIAERGLYRH